VARYRGKDETDLRWNAIRRRITRELDTQLQDWREVALDKLLTQAWTDYARQLESGEVRVLETHFAQFVKTALDDVIDVEFEDPEAGESAEGSGAPKFWKSLGRRAA